MVSFGQCFTNFPHNINIVHCLSMYTLSPYVINIRGMCTKQPKVIFFGFMVLITIPVLSDKYLARFSVKPDTAGCLYFTGIRHIPETTTRKR